MLTATLTQATDHLQDVMRDVLHTLATAARVCPVCAGLGRGYFYPGSRTIAVSCTACAATGERGDGDAYDTLLLMIDLLRIEASDAIAAATRAAEAAREEEPF